ncbi:hypothetical protein EGE62_22815 [Salmonella enterica]|nr:hypothetical protein [Salmonella enterica]
MERKIAFWSFGAVLGALLAANVQIVAAIVFAAHANPSFAEFLSLFRGESFAANLAVCAGVGVIAMENWRRRQSKASGPAVARASNGHGQRNT